MKRVVKRAGLAVLVIGVFSLVLFIGAVQFTNRSDFCTTCHYMQPFYDAWASSSHHDVPCRDCHYEPGYSNVIKGKFRDLNQLVKYWTNAYRRSKPWAEISDASCLRSGCHSHRLLEGQVEFGNVNFNHTPHLAQMRRGKKLRCTSCHSHIVQGKHMTVTTSTCVTCHFKLDEEGNNLAECTICHDPPVAARGAEPPKYDHTRVLAKELDCRKCHGEMVVGDGAVPRERCYACHWDRERLDQYDNTDVMHSMHITENKIECELCHLSMQHKSVAKEKAMPECQTCHEGFHEAQKDLFVGHGGLGVHDSPNPMFEKGLTCQGCHVFHEESHGIDFEGETFLASGESCEPCHGEGYNRLLANWQKSAKKKMATVQTALADAHMAQRQFSGDASQKQEIDSLIREAEYNYELVESGRPIHNIVYANELLKAAYNRLEQALTITQPGLALEPMENGDHFVPSACVNCHSGIEEINVNVFGIDFSHKRHLRKAHETCGRCHSNQRSHGELIVQRSDCLDCHHSQEERNCDYCHTAQASILRGDTDHLPLEEPDFMVDAGVECRDCHELPDRSIVRPVPQRCADCHDDDYADIQREWLSEFAELRASVDKLYYRAVELPPSDRRDEIVSDIRRHLEAIDTDGSRGSHNHLEQMRILEEDQERLESLLETTG
jgi:nitrate/TMAO reductase-like tetraheme cytochrome c subunit